MQVKTEESDGYNALQLGFGDVKASRQKKPAVGHAKKAETKPKAFVREIRLVEAPENEVGDTLTVEVFQEVKYVDVVGTTKGRGFVGVVKRYGYKGQPASHGVERKHRSPGSIGVAPGAKGRSIKKGKKMAGHLGCNRKTTRNHQVVAVDTENNLLLVKGSIAGANSGYVMLSKAKTKG